MTVQKINIQDVCDACEVGNLRQLKAWNSAGLLPDLRQRATYAAPHELAAVNGRLDILKYLVDETDQFVDVTASNNYAVRVAAGHGHLGIVRWLVEESKQAVDVTAFFDLAVIGAAEGGHLAVVRYLAEDACRASKLNPAWAGREVPQVDLASSDNKALRDALRFGRLAVVKYLIEDSGQLRRMLQTSQHWISALPEDLQQYILEWQTADVRLQQLQLTVADRDDCLASAACRKIVVSGLPVTKAQLLEFVALAAKRPPTVTRL